MSAPTVTGTSILLQEHYFNTNNVYMLSASMRGLLCHTADDVMLLKVCIFIALIFSILRFTIVLQQYL